MNDEDCAENIRDILQLAGDLTVQLVALSLDAKEIDGFGSGFLLKLNKKIYVVSAGHVFEGGRWTIETSIVKEGPLSVSIPVGGAWTMRKLTLGDSEAKLVEVGWARVDLDTFQKSVEADTGLHGQAWGYTLYQGPLDTIPNREDPYIYSALNQSEIIPVNGNQAVRRLRSYEFEMQYEGTNGQGMYVFTVPEHKGDDYYEGASGAPIIDVTGRIFAVLVAGRKREDHLYGFPLKGVIDLIRIAEDSERCESKA